MAADVANGNEFTASGDDILLVKNNGGGIPFYFTITSKAGPLQRTGDITQYDVGIDITSAFRLKNLRWRQSDGKIYLKVEEALPLIGMSLPE